MSNHNNRAVLGVFGLAGSGKTRYSRKYLEEFPRAIIIEGGFPGEREYPGRKVETLAEFNDFMLAHHEGLFQVRYVPAPEEFRWVCSWAREAGDCLLLIDEADRYLQTGKIAPEFMDLVARSRHYGKYMGVPLVVIAQNPMQIPIDVRRQSTSLIVFNTAEPADKEWLGKMMGKEWEEKAPLLQPGEFIDWTKGQGATVKHLSEVGA